MGDRSYKLPLGNLNLDAPQYARSLVQLAKEGAYVGPAIGKMPMSHRRQGRIAQCSYFGITFRLSIRSPNETKNEVPKFTHFHPHV